jgi:hypothetical protein
MAFAGLLKSLLEALAAYLQLRNKAFYHNLHRESQQKQKDIINEIEALRAKRTAAGTERADLLQSELIAEKQYLEHISAFYNNLESRNNNSDKGGPVQPTT